LKGIYFWGVKQNILSAVCVYGLLLDHEDIPPIGKLLSVYTVSQPRREEVLFLVTALKNSNLKFP
jgi:hypothetical protein